jgi:flagellar hook-associated protein 2
LSGQGIDVSSVVNQIISEETGPITVWQGQETTIASQNGELDGINNDLTNLQTAVQALSDPVGVFTNQTVSTSQPAVVTASADTSAVAGTHQIVVTSLATAGTLYSDPIAAGAATSFLASGQTSGDVQLQVGTGSTASTFDIPITQGSNDTLNTLAAYINTQSTAGKWGVTASVVSDASGSRLALESQNTGSVGALAIASNTNTALTFVAPLGGANAVLSIDGVPFSSATYTVTGAIQGVTLNLVSASPGNTVQLTVAPDTAGVTSAVSNFITAYNTLITDINAQYVVDPTGVTPAPPLVADLGLRTVQASVLADAAFSITGNSGFVNLESLGINTANDGTLSQGTSATGQTLSNLTNATSGPLNAEVAQNNVENTDLTTSVTNLQTQLAAQTTALTTQFENVNASLQAYPLLLQEITETLGTLGSGTSSTSSTGVTAPTLTSGL